MKNPFEIVKGRYITEKAKVLEQLHSSESNASLARCKSPKYVFLVDQKASKPDIAVAIEMIFKEQDVHVTSVNTMNIKGKLRRRGRGRMGRSALVKKAVVTLEEGDVIDNV